MEEKIELTTKEKIKNILIGELKNYTRTQIIAINALLCALVLLFALVPLKLGALDLAVIPIIAIIISTQLMGLLNGTLTGLFFGLVSFINHIVRHPSVLSDIFIKNPLVTFLPRILIATFVFLVMKGLDYCFNKINLSSEKSKKITPKILTTIKYAVSALVGVIVNTAGVLGIMYAFYHGNTLASGTVIGPAFISGIILTNSILEAVVCTVLTPAIVIAVKKTLEFSMRKKKK